MAQLRLACRGARDLVRASLAELLVSALHPGPTIPVAKIARAFPALRALDFERNVRHGNGSALSRLTALTSLRVAYPVPQVLTACTNLRNLVLRFQTATPSEVPEWVWGKALAGLQHLQHLRVSKALLIK